jgi:hypothetical protein
MHQKAALLDSGKGTAIGQDGGDIVLGRHDLAVLGINDVVETHLHRGVDGEIQQGLGLRKTRIQQGQHMRRSFGPPFWQFVYTAHPHPKVRPFRRHAHLQSLFVASHGTVTQPGRHRPAKHAVILALFQIT